MSNIKTTFTFTPEELTLLTSALHTHTVHAITPYLESQSPSNDGFHHPTAQEQLQSVTALITRLKGSQDYFLLDALWIADDGSWGDGEVAIFDTSKWGSLQNRWFEKLTNDGDPDEQDVLDIHNKRKPEGLEG
jgi:hypothetical protein